MKNIKKRKSNLINILVYTVILALIISLMHIRYLLLVNEGKAVSIQILKEMIIKGVVEQYDSIASKDSIILELKIEIGSLEIDKN